MSEPKTGNVYDWIDYAHSLKQESYNLEHKISMLDYYLKEISSGLAKGLSSADIQGITMDAIKIAKP